MGITVSHTAMLTHCHALTQACGYTEGEGHLSHASRHLLCLVLAAKEVMNSLGMI